MLRRALVTELISTGSRFAYSVSILTLLASAASSDVASTTEQLLISRIPTRTFGVSTNPRKYKGIPTRFGALTDAFFAGPSSAQLFRRCDFELIGDVFLSGHACSFRFQVALLLFRPHWPSECNFAVLNEDFDIAPVGGETPVVMDRFSDFLRNRAARGIHLPLIRGRAYPIVY